MLGLPINKLICASNENNVLYDFIKTGVYDRNREFHKTISPSNGYFGFKQFGKIIVFHKR